VERKAPFDITVHRDIEIRVCSGYRYTHLLQSSYTIKVSTLVSLNR